jgi:alcohol dehydrogenase (cytochrome c)
VKKLAFIILALAVCLPAQELDPSKLLNPGTDSWPTFNGDYSGRRYSTLAQINQSNVSSLALAWAFQSRSQGSFSSMPLVANGIMYVALPDQVWAIDARTGRQIWHFQRPSQGGGNRGVAMYKDRLFFTTPDTHVICLDARNGKLLWDVQMEDPAFKAFASMAPLVIRDHVLVAGSGDAADLPGFLESLDPMTGKVQWRWDSEPKPGEPGSETWPQDSDVMSRGGGMLWLTGTYDPELNLTYWGTGNPHPVENGEPRPGANLYTCSIVALNPDTGKMAWYFQASPHDTHDWDTNMTPVLFDADFDGKPRKLLAQAAKQGLFFVLDRTNGKALVSAPFAEANWYSGWDERGQPIPRAETEPKPSGVLVRSGQTNWNAPSFDPQTGLFYINEREGIGVFYLTMPGKKAEGWAGRDFTVVSKSFLKAIDYQTGKIKWSRESSGRGGFTGILTTAGHLLFTADSAGNLVALDPATGKTLWHMYPGGTLGTAPMTYELDGRQYLVMPVDGVIFAFALPARQQ